MKPAIAAALTLAALSVQPSLAADDTAVMKDLTAVIALQGKPCGEVVSIQAKGEADFVATCKDGNKYRVYTKDGRVVVEKQ